MGIGRFLKSMVDPKTLGEEIVNTQVRVYLSLAASQPHAEPHELLAQVWLQRMTLRGKHPGTQAFEMVAFSETSQFACLPPPKNARALGLYFIYKERPDIIQRFPQFALEFESLMGPVMQALEQDRFAEMYALYNSPLPPSTPDGSSFETAIVLEGAVLGLAALDEYKYLRERYPNCKFNSQSLREHRGKSFDVIEFTTADGNSKTCYFALSEM